MAIIDCLECKSKVSDYASSCPACGYLVSKDSKIVGRKRKRLINEVPQYLRSKYGPVPVWASSIIVGVVLAILGENWLWLIICPIGPLLLWAWGNPKEKSLEDKKEVCQ